MANNIRTPEELKKPEYNYFIALKLGVKEKNQSNIEKAINKACGSTSGDLMSRRLIELRQDITEIMVNDSTYNPTTGAYVPNSGGRQHEAAAAKELKLNEIMKLVQNMCMSNGRIFKSTLNELCITANKTAEYFTIDELTKKCDSLKSQGIKFIDNTISIIPFGDFEKASKLLETPPIRAHLYEFLGVPNTASTAEITAARKKVYDEAQSKNDLKIKQSVSALCASVDSILSKSPDVRKQYDYYIEVKESVWDQFKMRKTYGAKSISVAEYYNFAETLQKALRLDVDAVENMLGAGLKYYNLVLAGDDGDGTKPGDIPDLELCPYEDCAQIYRAGAKICPHCNRPLQVVCWNCESTVPFTTKNKSCTSCGAAHSGKDRFIELSRDIDDLLSSTQSDIPKLRAALITLKNLVPNDRGVGKSAVAKKISSCEELIKEKVAEDERLGEKYRAEEKNVNANVAQKNYMTALNIASNMRRAFPTYNVEKTNQLVSSIQKFTVQAQNLFETAKKYAAQGNEAMMIEYAAKALEVCNDHLEAKQFIRKYPPAAPVQPKILVSDNSKVHLEWNKVGDQKLVTYKLIKKIGSAPSNIDDGSVVEDNLEINFYEDANIVSATPYYYAVVAERCGVCSGILNFPTPVQVFGDVVNIKQEVVQGKISVVWDAPQNFASIDVWKKEGLVPPLSPGDGVKLSGNKEGFVDNDCSGENSYLIVCSFKTMDGVKYSKGVTQTFKKYDIIKKLENVSIIQNTDVEFCLSCNNPSNEKIRLLFSPNKLPCRTETVLQMTDYNMCFKGASALNIFYDAENRTCFNVPKNTIGYVYVVVYNEQLFCSATPVVVNTVSGISNISYEEQPGAIKVKGVLNPNTKRVIAKISDKQFAKNINDAGEQIAITKEQFNKDGGFVIKLKNNASHYISILSELDVGGKIALSCITPLGNVIDMREKALVDYCMECSPTLTKPFKVVIKFESDTPVELPNMVLMKGVPRPMNKSMGTLAERIDGVVLKKGIFSSKYTAKISLTLPPDRQGMKFILFFADEHVKHAKLREISKI